MKGKKVKILSIMLLLFLAIVFPFCKQGEKQQETLFEALESDQTGLSFENKLTPTTEFNLFKYLYYYNGAGVAAGDFNNDGLIDLFFSSNQQQNKLYLNKGGMKFDDVTTAAKIPNDGGWSTGVSVVDINNDGLLDIYVCRVGNYDVLKSKNQFLICKGVDKNGVPYYEDEAGKMGLDFSGLSTQAAFLDYDMDGDLDMYLMNHSLRYTGTYNARATYLNSFDTLSGDYLFQNESSKLNTEPSGSLPVFKDVSKASGISGYIIGYGLGIVVSDINMDGWPDIYIGNDFHENDYLYINQKNGTFKDVMTEQMMHTSQFSMGVDAADINNDALPEIISVDMMPSDPYILKRSLGEDDYTLYNFKLRHGYHPQFARNTLQLNKGNNLFSEVGLYSNVFATDWSWAPLFTDFDNDGQKDIFISNGIPKRMNDFDYINYVSSEEVQTKARENKLDERDLSLIDKFPQIKLPNKFYLNKGNAKFEDAGKKIKNNKPTFSNGSVYADFDNDGDIDIVVNNINDPVIVYKNTSNDKVEKTRYLKIQPTGADNNINSLGAKVIVFAGNEKRTYEKYPVRGFQGSMEIPFLIGLNNTKPDSIYFIWPDNTFEKLPPITDTLLKINYKTGLPLVNYNQVLSAGTFFKNKVNDVTQSTGLLYKHIENPFNEFDREPLVPFMTSREGPALAVGDINNDGLEDVFIGAAKAEKPALFLQKANGRFDKLLVPALVSDSTYEDVDACFTDINNDGFLDLIVSSGGNEYYGESEFLLPRVYINDKQNGFVKNKTAFSNILVTASCVTPFDFTGDGFIDLFIGGRAVPWQYGKLPRSFLLQNDGKGSFKDVTAKYNKDLAEVGFVKDADWADLNGDKIPELVVALEWGGIVAFQKDNSTFKKITLTDKSGWWNCIVPFDADGDGDLDLLAGNAGMNTRIKPSAEEPVRIYYTDVDNNGKKEQILTYYLEGKEIPLSTKEELQKQIPSLKKKYLYAADFAKASLNDLFGASVLKNAEMLTADYFANVLFVNNGNMNFTLQELPWQAQLTPIRDAAVVDVDNDNRPDLLLGTNFFPCNIQLGKYDADYGMVLVNNGKNNFSAVMLNGKVIKGEVRRVKEIKIGSTPASIMARNNDSLLVLRFGK